MVVQEIAETQLRDHYKNSDYAILYRTNAQSRIFEEALRKRNIPYKIYGGLSFYQRKEIKDLLAYFRLTINPADNEALKRIINFPARGIGSTTLEKLEEAAVTNETSIWKIIENLSTNNLASLNKGTITKLQHFAALIQNFQVVTEENDAFNAAKIIAENSGILVELYNDKSPEGVSRYDNIQELLNGIQEFSLNAMETGEPAKLGNYLEDVALLTDQDNDKDEDRDKVTLMTVHSAKGLEFKNVFVVGLEEDLFPSLRQGEKQTDDALEEERRLFYVALTRAKENACFSYANQRYRWGNLDFCSPSRFLEELDEQYLDQSGNSAFNNTGRNRSFFGSETTRTQFTRPTTTPFFKSVHQQNIYGKKLASLKETSGDSSFAADDSSKIQTGMTVEHQRFGEGKVLKIEGEMPNIKATIFFQGSGQKQLLLKFAKLKIKG
jgi:DNA helicase-2/ATP-dependent DNA helicase PcrA